MPARAVLNTYYAYRVKDMDSKQRKSFDDSLHGWAEQNAAADKALFDVSGGES